MVIQYASHLTKFNALFWTNSFWESVCGFHSNTGHVAACPVLLCWLWCEGLGWITEVKVSIIRDSEMWFSKYLRAAWFSALYYFHGVWEPTEFFLKWHHLSGCKYHLKTLKLHDQYTHTHIHTETQRTFGLFQPQRHIHCTVQSVHITAPRLHAAAGSCFQLKRSD